MRRPHDQDWVSNLVSVVVDLGHDRAFVLHVAANEAETVPVAIEHGSVHLKVLVKIEAVLVALVAQAKLLFNQASQRKLGFQWLVRIRVEDVKEEHFVDGVIVRDLFKLLPRQIS